MAMLRLLSGGGLMIALILNIIALTTPGWIYYPNSSFGLFNFESSIGKGKVMKTNAEKVAIAFNIMSDVILLCAAPLVLIAGKDDGKKRAGLVGGIMAIIAALFIMIGMATYTGIYEDNIKLNLRDLSWGYSYIFGWIAFGLSLIGGIIAAAGGNSSSYDWKNVNDS